MSGGGHIADMVARMKQSREMFKKKRFFKQHPKAGDIDFSKHVEHKLHYEKASKKQLQKIREEVEKEQRKIVVKRIVILFVSVTITIFIVLYVYDYFSKLGGVH